MFKALVTLSALLACASGFVPRAVAQHQRAAARAAPAARAPRASARTARAALFNRKPKGPSEAELAAERAAAQDALNEQWAKDSENEFYLMSAFGESRHTRPPLSRAFGRAARAPRARGAWTRCRGGRAAAEGAGNRLEHAVTVGLYA